MFKTLLLLTFLSGTICQLVSKSHHKKPADMFKDFEKQFDLNKIDTIFDDFTKTFGKYYFQPSEKTTRKQIFAKNALKVVSHNKIKTHKYQQGINKFSDLTFNEFKSKLLMSNLEAEVKNFINRTEQSILPVVNLKKNNRILVENRLNSSERKLKKLKKSVSWKSYAGKIKDQQNCSGCYAFSATASFEVMLRIHRNKNYVLSEQSMIDCVTANNGCDSGSPGAVLDYIASTGIAKSQRYPFLGKTDDCNGDVMSAGSLVSDSIDYSYLDKGIMSILTALQSGPVIVLHTVNANFRNYMSGVFDDDTCTDPLDHSTLAIGYNLNAAVPYIEIKNSWADDWGEKGFFRVAIGEMAASNGGICQIANHGYNMAVIFDH